VNLISAEKESPPLRVGGSPGKKKTPPARESRPLLSTPELARGRETPKGFPSGEKDAPAFLPEAGPGREKPATAENREERRKEKNRKGASCSKAYFLSARGKKARGQMRRFTKRRKKSSVRGSLFEGKNWMVLVKGPPGARTKKEKSQSGGAPGKKESRVASREKCSGF